MPIYEYWCESCGAREERLEPMGAPVRHACEACGGEEGMRRQHSVPAVAVGAAAGEAPACGVGGGCPTGGCPFA